MQMTCVRRKARSALVSWPFLWASELLDPVRRKIHVQSPASEAERARGHLQGQRSVPRVRTGATFALGAAHDGTALLCHGARAPSSARGARSAAPRMVP